MFICLGACEMISGFISGKLADKFNLYKLASLSTLFAEVALILSLIGIFMEPGSNTYTFCFFIAGMWGLTDCFFSMIC